MLAPIDSQHLDRACLDCLRCGRLSWTVLHLPASKALDERPSTAHPPVRRGLTLALLLSPGRRQCSMVSKHAAILVQRRVQQGTPTRCGGAADLLPALLRAGCHTCTLQALPGEVSARVGVVGLVLVDWYWWIGVG